VLDAIEKKKARAIYGNHELSYIMPGQHRCSGWDRERAYIVQQHTMKIIELFEPYILLDPYVLVSHAGLTNQLWEESKTTPENLKETLDAWWPNPKSPMHQIGWSRGCSGVTLIVSLSL